MCKNFFSLNVLFEFNFLKFRLPRPESISSWGVLMAPPLRITSSENISLLKGKYLNESMKIIHIFLFLITCSELLCLPLLKQLHPHSLLPLEQNPRHQNIRQRLQVLEHWNILSYCYWGNDNSFGNFIPKYWILKLVWQIIREIWGMPSK